MRRGITLPLSVSLSLPHSLSLSSPPPLFLFLLLLSLSFLQGAFPPTYYEWIIKQGGIDTESSYPYNGEPGACKPTNQYAAQLTGYVNVEVCLRNHPNATQ